MSTAIDVTWNTRFRACLPLRRSRRDDGIKEEEVGLPDEPISVFVQLLSTVSC